MASGQYGQTHVIPALFWTSPFWTYSDPSGALFTLSGRLHAPAALLILLMACIAVLTLIWAAGDASAFSGLFAAGPQMPPSRIAEVGEERAA